MPYPIDIMSGCNELLFVDFGNDRLLRLKAFNGVQTDASTRLVASFFKAFSPPYHRLLTLMTLSITTVETTVFRCEGCETCSHHRFSLAIMLGLTGY